MLYYHKYNTVPNGIDFSGASLNFSNTYALGYADKESAINAAASMSCPEGKD